MTPMAPLQPHSRHWPAFIRSENSFRLWLPHADQRLDMSRCTIYLCAIPQHGWLRVPAPANSCMSVAQTSPMGLTVPAALVATQHFGADTWKDDPLPRMIAAANIEETSKYSYSMRECSCSSFHRQVRAQYTLGHADWSAKWIGEWKQWSRQLCSQQSQDFSSSCDAYPDSLLSRVQVSKTT